MPIRLNQAAYAQLIEEDIQWLLDNTESSLEREHILEVLRHSIRVNYDEKYPTERMTQEENERLREALRMTREQISKFFSVRYSRSCIDAINTINEALKDEEGEALK